MTDIAAKEDEAEDPKLAEPTYLVVVKVAKHHVPRVLLGAPSGIARCLPLYTLRA